MTQVLVDRLVRPGGTVAACVWDFERGMRMLRHFWDAALTVDPAAPDEANVMRFGQAGEIGELFGSAGIEALTETTIEVTVAYSGFDELWSGFLAGIGPAGSYCVSLDDDRREDEAFGQDRRGDEVPAELARRETRLAKMRAAKEAIESDARHKAREQAAGKARQADKDHAEVHAAADAEAGKATPENKAQRNFADPEARMMKTNDGFHYAYNAQAVVDEASQVVLAAEITQSANDVNQLFDMIETANTAPQVAVCHGR